MSLSQEEIEALLDGVLPESVREVFVQHYRGDLDTLDDWVRHPIYERLSTFMIADCFDTGGRFPPVQKFLKQDRQTPDNAYDDKFSSLSADKKLFSKKEHDENQRFFQQCFDMETDVMEKERLHCWYCFYTTYATISELPDQKTNDIMEDLKEKPHVETGNIGVEEQCITLEGADDIEVIITDTKLTIRGKNSSFTGQRHLIDTLYVQRIKPSVSDDKPIYKIWVHVTLVTGNNHRVDLSLSHELDADITERVKEFAKEIEDSVIR